MKLKNHYFWTWFLENQEHVKTLRALCPERQKEIIHWLGWHLHFYCPGLDYLLVFHHKGKQFVELVITANGNPQFFGKAEGLVQDAPLLAGWKFTALIQPTGNHDRIAKGLDQPYVFQDITLRASDLSFVPLDSNRDKIDMVVYLRNFTAYSRSKNLPQLVFMIMQDILGEKSIHENVGFVELAQLPGEESTQLVRLCDLQFYIDQINSRRKDSP